MKKILFLTGTRADFGKLKPLIYEIQKSNDFEAHIFVTGMHMLSKYGATVEEVYKAGFKNIHTFINQTTSMPMDIILANTVQGLSNYIHEFRPDMIVVHGDRGEALAGAICGALNNILVAHVEGGEVSGTIDESIRHAVSKLAHIHFVSNEKAKKRLVQLGEKPESIFVIGSPDIDIMMGDQLPTLKEAKERYDVNFSSYAMFIYHPVTTDLENLEKNISVVIGSLIKSGLNYIVVYPNNDPGSDIILDHIMELKKYKQFKVFPSIRFEHYLTFFKNSLFTIGNSSVGIRVSDIYGKMAVDIGSRQKNRYEGSSVIHVEENEKDILNAIKKAQTRSPKVKFNFGKGNSAQAFSKILKTNKLWSISVQKQFLDVI